MVLPDFSEVDACGAFGSDGGMRWDEVCTFSDAVYNVHDHVVAMRMRKFHYEVNTHHIPSLFGSLRCMEFSRGAAVLEFGPIAEVTGLHIESDVVGHLGPPVVPCDEF